MILPQSRSTLIPAIIATFVASCAVGEDGRDSLFGDLGGPEGSADMVSAARASSLGDIPLDGSRSGTWQRGVRAYSFTFEARAGAVVSVAIQDAAGRGSTTLEANALMDVETMVLGPGSGASLGAELDVSDEDEGGPASLSIRVPEDGTYLVAFGSWDDPGTSGTYSVRLGCAGTDFQCTRPVRDVPCRPGTEYVRGGTVIGEGGGTVEWSACEVVLLEEVHVAEGAILHIRPGVHVRGNYIAERTYGTVRLVVDGQLQAVGTETNPVVFEAYTPDNGWGGLVLNGASNSLEHVYVEGARLGIEVSGGRNSFVHLNINSCEAGIRFNPTSLDNLVRGIRIGQVRNGIEILGAERSANESSDPTAVEIYDSIILGLGQDGGVGISGRLAERSVLHGSLISRFQTGLHLDRTRLEVYDATISQNARGVTVTGDNAGVTPQRACPAMPAYTPPPPRPPAPPARWYPDPVFVRCDIVDNAEWGIKVLAPELLVVEHCNVRGNGAGIVVEADGLHEDSRIRESNLFGNGESGVQVEAFHRFGVLDLTDNYWAQVSDPALSASWSTHHEDPYTCRETRDWDYIYNSCGAPSGSSATCGSYSCTGTRGRNAWVCTWRGRDAWDSVVDFEGFYPTAVAAGPRLDEDNPDQQQVIQERQAQGI